ncbi:MAG: hypothetical protein HY727_15625 [Candidatus Rokubacteria bacterium]|nr:hypothetical protein [Candidatus Rokubacteria bacterium]
MRVLTRALGGIAAGVRARPGVFAAAAACVLLAQFVLPPLVLSIVRKPWDFFTFNPWLKKLPEYLMGGEATLRRKAEVVPNLALFWFSADSPYGGVEWGFAVDVSDFGRWVLTAALFGTYFALWAHRRDRRAVVGFGPPVGRQGGVVGALVSVVGFTTGPCSVMGCGAPVIPVVGLAFVGLSSGTLQLLTMLSRVATAVVLVGMTAGVLYFGWRVGPRSDART